MSGDEAVPRRTRAGRPRRRRLGLDAFEADRPAGERLELFVGLPDSARRSLWRGLGTAEAELREQEHGQGLHDIHTNRRGVGR